MFISVFDLFKIGIGPSSSHTMGPMTAAIRFLSALKNISLNKDIHISASLHGSLAFTGKGHASDQAIILGLLNLRPDTIDPDKIKDYISNLTHIKTLKLHNGIEAKFDPKEDIIFDYGPPLDGHPNGMKFYAKEPDGTEILTETYYSIGGGFVLSEDELEEHAKQDITSPDLDVSNIPYPFRNAAEMLEMADESGLSIAEMKRQNERRHRPVGETSEGIQKIWGIMNSCIDRGLNRNGQLPGELKVNRRAQDIHEQLKDEEQNNSKSYHVCNEWLSVYAMAVNEENASGGQVVTAPTNGAAGVIPAVVRYYLDFTPGADKAGIEEFLLTAAAIGGIIKNNASISGAEVGCQGEVGSASAMAAAGLCAALGGTPQQIENAAEIALEHHLGMTCDPVGGLVQIPCIERNGLGAVKAVTAASLALRGDGTHVIPLDNCIETMRQTGLDMSNRYKETSQGGLAVNLPEC